ncbi:two pore domain potassium channel family protein [Methylolobus aquaticus]|nr:two pore domain potassium channel family protein [Methylolobus aquaticus]
MRSESELRIGFKVQGPQEFWRDVRLNRRWLSWLVTSAVLYILLSALLFHMAEPQTYWKSLYFTVLNFSCGFANVYATTRMGEATAMVNAVAGVVWFGFFLAILAHSLAPTELSGTVSAPALNPAVNGDGEADSPSKSIERAVADITKSVASIARNAEGAEGPRRLEARGMDILIESGAEDGSPRHIFVHVRVR